jgi:hypothetical protein
VLCISIFIKQPLVLSPRTRTRQCPPPRRLDVALRAGGGERRDGGSCLDARSCR